MALMRYEPYRLLSQLQNEIDRMFEGRLVPEGEGRMAAGDWYPAVDIKEEEQRFLITADVPGVDPKSIAITLENGVLTIEGKRETEAREERNGYRRVERVSGRFVRSFTLPDSADPERVAARSNHGVLEVEIGKRAAAQPRRIAVHVE